MNPDRRACLLTLPALIILGSSIAPPARGAGLLEQEIVFSEADIAHELARRGPITRRYGNLLTLTLQEAPRIRLGEPPARATLNARLLLAVLGAATLPVDLEGTTGIRYDDTQKAFFLDAPQVHHLHAAALPAESRALAREAVTQLLQHYCRTQPVYTLRDNGSLQEKTAIWLLRSIRIEPGRVAATLSPFQ